MTITLIPTAAGLKSSHAGDPVMKPLVEKFVGVLPDRISLIRQLLCTNNLEDLQRSLHQMKGAGGGYGFAAISTAAALAEEVVKARRGGDAIAREVQAFVSLVRSVQGYDRQREVEPTP